MILTETLRLGRRFVTEARNLPQTVALVWAATRRWTALWLALLVVQGLLPAAAVYLTKDVVDALLSAIRSGGGAATIPALVARAAPLATVMVLQAIASGVTRWVRFHQSEILQDYISRKIHEKSVAVKLRFYDFPEYFDHLYRARDEASHRPAALLEVTGALLQNSVTSVGVAAVLIPYGFWLPVALLFGSVPSLLLVLRNSLRRQEWKRQSTPQVRKAGYLDYLVTSREAAAEIRVFDFGAHLIEAYQLLRRTLVDEQSRLVRREAMAELFATVLAMIMAAGAAGWVVWQAIAGRLTPGSLALFFAAFMQAQALMLSLLDNAAQLYMNSLFLGDLFEFLHLEDESDVVTPGTPAIVTSLRRGIRFEAVDFTYPGASRDALANFSLDVPAGRIVAIVGPNGAGKSTIIKLLCRFYDPRQGRILIDDRNISDRPASEIRGLVSVLFQDAIRYSAPVAENIAPVSSRISRQRLEGAVRAAGAEGIVARLSNGYDTLLGKWFDDGVELSGGEWQRLALARAFARDTPILLLDEPTSAMDSWAEADWFARFRPVSVGRTTIVITHRFTTAMQADVIHVMDDGRIVESGTHGQLLALGGRYAASWHAQTGERVAGVAIEQLR